MPEKRTFGQKMRDAAGWVFHTPDSDDEDGTAGVPARPSRPPSLSPMEAELAESDFYEDDMVIAAPAPPNHFERYRALIDSFDEDRESGLEKVVRWFFLLFSLASGLAQWFIALLHVGGLHDHAGLAALVFRVAMVPAVDIASLLFLAVMNFKSLKKFVADQRTRAQAIRDINEAELEIQRAQSAAARREQEERQDLVMKEQRNQVWLELDRLHAQSMLADAKRRALPAPATVTPDLEALPASVMDAPQADQVKVRRIERSS